jgi:hypothetical protein
MATLAVVGTSIETGKIWFNSVNSKKSSLVFEGDISEICGFDTEDMSIAEINSEMLGVGSFTEEREFGNAETLNRAGRVIEICVDGDNVFITDQENPSKWEKFTRSHYGFDIEDAPQDVAEGIVEYLND